MKSSCIIIFTLLILFSATTWAQNEEVIPQKKDTLIVESNSQVRETIDPLTPSRAAFYSAILPGLGQAYNKKYWKIPIIYAALGTGIYFYIDNTNEYKRYRDVFKRRLAGFTDDEFQGISDEALIRAQKSLSKDREISLLVTVGIYALNIIDANVDAHLLQYNVDENLALQPHFKINEWDMTTNLGLTLNFNF